jgi:hypothetical protein
MTSTSQRLHAAGFNDVLIYLSVVFGHIEVNLMYIEYVDFDLFTERIRAMEMVRFDSFVVFS